MAVTSDVGLLLVGVKAEDLSFYGEEDFGSGVCRSG